MGPIENNIYISPTGSFVNSQVTLESCWRAIILFGRNVASYKFALAKSLLELVDNETTFVSLDDLALPYATHVANHLKHNDKQATSSSSKFLQTCRDFNQGIIDEEQLRSLTVTLGFNNVIDAFHVVNRGETPIRFYDDQRKSVKKGLVVTDELLKLKESLQYTNLPSEVEARWRLVETAWDLGVSTHSLAISYDSESQILFTPHLRRTAITSCRDALNGYQKGKCFYCFDDISIKSESEKLADVDHYFPHTLKQVNQSVNFDGVWNLVLACKSCNRGENGKFARLPEAKLLERLRRRNDFLISSHHPLRETLILQTGKTEDQRRNFLQQMDDFAINHLIHRWSPSFEYEACF